MEPSTHAAALSADLDSAFEQLCPKEETVGPPGVPEEVRRWAKQKAAAIVGGIVGPIEDRIREVADRPVIFNSVSGKDYIKPHATVGRSRQRRRRGRIASVLAVVLWVAAGALLFQGRIED